MEVGNWVVYIRKDHTNTDIQPGVPYKIVLHPKYGMVIEVDISSHYNLSFNWKLVFPSKNTWYELDNE